MSVALDQMITLTTYGNAFLSQVLGSDAMGGFLSREAFTLRQCVRFVDRDERIDGWVET